MTVSVKIPIRGADLIRNPALNKGTGFSPQERRRFGLEGLLPVGTKTLQQQAERVYGQLRAQSDDLHKYMMLAALQNRNVHLFYRVLCDHIEELMPIVYTPTVGAASQQFSRVFQGGGGLWVTPDMKGRMAEVLAAAVAGREIRLLVVTDNESILGIGDQGAGGMAISIGKLALYTAAAGIPPSKAMPVSLDFGTDNENLLADRHYLGWPARRLRGEPYLELVDEFVAAVMSVTPGALVQWEDFRKDNALTILDRYADRLPSFNDDIQGTGAVVVAGLNSALQIKHEALAAQRIVILGAGAAALGIARQIRTQLAEEGLSEGDQRAAVATLDRNGLLIDDGRPMDAYKRELAWTPATARAHGLEAAQGRMLFDVVRRFRPSILIGVSGVAGAFDERTVREMAAYSDRPVIFPCSNPSANSEAVPADLSAWTHGRCLTASGSPFPGVGQGNNVFIFPGLGLATLVAGARKITPGMATAASKALAAQVTAEERRRGLLFPAVSRLREVSRNIALAAARQAIADGVAEIRSEDVESRIAEAMWTPEYSEYEAV